MKPKDKIPFLFINPLLIEYNSILYATEQTSCLLKKFCCAVPDLKTSEEDVIIQESNLAILSSPGPHLCQVSAASAWEANEGQIKYKLQLNAWTLKRKGGGQRSRGTIFPETWRHHSSSTTRVAKPITILNMKHLHWSFHKISMKHSLSAERAGFIDTNYSHRSGATIACFINTAYHIVLIKISKK